MAQRQAPQPSAHRSYRDPAAQRQGARHRGFLQSGALHGGGSGFLPLPRPTSPPPPPPPTPSGGPPPPTGPSTARVPAPCGCSTATVLASGKVLVAGSWNPSGYVTRAELYDLATGGWSSAGDLAAGRAYHTATLLPNGKVLVAGGLNGST